jgi:tetratricopeptide (TPR) repeat protein
MICEALTYYSVLRQRQFDFPKAVYFAEEAYNLVVEAYDCVHLQVQEAAGVLIEILIAKGDLFDAERYAQVTYGNLRDKKNGIDQEGDEVANGAFNLADVIYRQKGDLIKAEELARESLRINQISSVDSHRVGTCCDLLANILTAQKKLGDETRNLFERCLAISIRRDGLDCVNTGVFNVNISKFYGELAIFSPNEYLCFLHLQKAKSHLEEGLRIYMKVYGPSHPNTIRISSDFNGLLNLINQRKN